MWRFWENSFVKSSIIKYFPCCDSEDESRNDSWVLRRKKRGIMHYVVLVKLDPGPDSSYHLLEETCCSPSITGRTSKRYIISFFRNTRPLPLLDRALVIHPSSVRNTASAETVNQGHRQKPTRQLHPVMFYNVKKILREHSRRHSTTQSRHAELGRSCAWSVCRSIVTLLL